MKLYQDILHDDATGRLSQVTDLPAMLNTMSIGSQENFTRDHPSQPGMVTVVVERRGHSEWILFSTEDESAHVRVKNPNTERVSALITQLLRYPKKDLKTWAECHINSAHGASYIGEGLPDE